MFKETVEHLDIAVINLDRRPDRIDYLYKHSPLIFRKFAAIDGEHLSKHYFEFPELLDTIRNQPRVFGEVGCSLSHYSLWKQHLERPNECEYMLIFEDDVIFTEHSVERLKETICRDISNIDFDLLYVGGQWTPDYDIDGTRQPYFQFQATTRESLETHYRRPAGAGAGATTTAGIYKRRNRAPAVIQGNRNVWFSPLFRTAGAYLVSRRGAKRLMEAVETDTALFMKTPLDMWLLEMDFRGYIETFDRFPHPFYQAGFEMVREPSHALNDIHRTVHKTVELPPGFVSRELNELH
jgi:GR25 family glycosyltransferase involved in LPS biosynthesis